MEQSKWLNERSVGMLKWLERSTSIHESLICFPGHSDFTPQACLEQAAEAETESFDAVLPFPISMERP